MVNTIAFIVSTQLIIDLLPRQKTVIRKNWKSYDEHLGIEFFKLILCTE